MSSGELGWPVFRIERIGKRGPGARVLGCVTKILTVLGAVVLIAAGCGGDDSGGPAPDPTTSTVDSDPDPGSGSDQGATGDAGSMTSTVSDGWSLTEVAVGIKPVLALDPDGEPGIAFLEERVSGGFVSYASRATGWTVEEFVEGYFYGPIGLDFDPAGSPHVVYHDHQSGQFRPELGDLTYAVRTDEGWQVSAARDDGHDGWDSVIAVGDDGVVRAAGIDPSQFGSSDGVEYYELVDGSWEVTSVSGGEPIAYEFNVDLQVDPDGRPAVTYFATDAQDLVFAGRDADGVWRRELVDESGDVGRYSSLAFSDDGVAHIAYWDATNGEVKHATNGSGSWVTSSVGTLGAVEPGQQGARRIASIDVDSDGSPAIAFSDTTGIWLARLVGDQWETAQVVEAGARPLGQLVSMRLDGSDAVHLAFFEVTGTSPLLGVIGHLIAV